jgi:superfamily II DNA or RNA helicase
LFTVSFIKKAGLNLIIDDIESALKRGVVGKIVTSTYQNFTDIPTLNQLLYWSNQYPNFECHLDIHRFGTEGFHTKGYIFGYKDKYEIIIGSSNITRFALLHNVEWNVYTTMNEENNYYNTVTDEFQHIWEKSLPLSNRNIQEYQTHLDYAIERWDMDYFQDMITIKPNYMQRKALAELRRYRNQNINKALVIAATGSGKTHLAAFDANNFGAKNLLFVVHRENILIEARNTFASIFGNTLTYGLFTGNQKDINKDFIFATNVMMASNLYLFDEKRFDYIIMDEVHHAAADTYQKIIKYFKPDFLLGLTATPDRMDDKDIYEIFDKNIPFDLRLRDAIINELVVPFEYYGIKDDLINYSEEDVNKLIRDISKQDHCLFVAKEIRKHLPQTKLKAIAYCKNVEHARQMAEGMSQQGFNTIQLTGSNSVGERIKVFHDLQDESNPLEILFTVDILNEGVDIPGINMVLFLRPTESSVIFLQQLGRGLRLYPNKPYLTVLDFIGNSYKRSVQIIKALGTLSKSAVLEKKLLIDLIRDDFKSLEIPGLKISFDQLSKEDIETYVQKTNFNTRLYLESDYKAFKKYLNTTTYPKHIDYLDYDTAPDLIRLIKSKFNGKTSGSYYNFLFNIGEPLPSFDEKQLDLIERLSSFLPLVRSYEYDIIKLLLSNDVLTKQQMIEIITDKQVFFKVHQFNNALSNLQNEFLSEEKKNQSNQLIINEEGYYKLNVSKDELFLEYMDDLITYGLSRYQDEFGDFQEDLKLYGNYTTEQFMMSICQRAYIYQKGTKIEKDGTVYILANLKKDASTIERLKYEDKFINDHVFQWESETNTTLEKHRGLLTAKTAHLFIRKIKSEDGITLPYTYIGRGKLTNPRPSKNEARSLLFDIVLDHPLPGYLKFDFEIHLEGKDNEKIN